MTSRNYAEIDLSFYDEAPAEGTVVQQTQYGVRIQWNPASGSGGYAVYRGRAEGNKWELLATLSETSTSFHDTKPLSQVRQDYKVTVLVEGDLQLEEVVVAGEVVTDLKVTKGYESARQDITNRIRTQTGDWGNHSHIGGDLELLEGEPNTRETAYKGASMIRKTLTQDARFSSTDIEVRPVPTSIHQIDFYTMLDTDRNKPLVVKNSSNLGL